MSLAADIQRLKKEKDAVVLAHYYADGEIQDVADYVGDSFYLAKMGQQVEQKVILLAGVVFMAESVKILNPNKKVLVPDLGSGCSLVNEAPYKQYLEWRKANPRGIAVTYINSSTEVKSISDVIVTSSNARQIVDAIPKDRPVLFGPDKNLGGYLSKELKRPFELWQGSCQVHVMFEAEQLIRLIKQHPDAVVIAHPECDDSVLMWASVIGSTSRLLEEVEKNPAKKFIIATETGILHEMKKRRPDAELIQAPIADGTCNCNDCPFMKMNSMQKVKKALETLSPEITINKDLSEKAKVSLDRMMAITAGKPVQWPESFQAP